MNAKRMPSLPAVPRPTQAATSRFTSRFRAVVVAGALLGAGAIHADWLVLRSGGAVETRGAWKVEGPKVIFTSTRGVLSSVRGTEVDVDASRTLTTKKQEEAARGGVTPTPTPKPPPVLVLTDKDFAKEPPPDAAAAAEASGEGAVEGEAPAGESGAAEGEDAAGEEGSSAPQTSAPPASAPPASAAQASGAQGAAAQQAAAAPGAGAAATGSSAAASSSATAKASTAPRAPAPRVAAPARGVAVPKQPVLVPSADSLETRVAHQMPGSPALRVASWSARPTGDEQLSIFGEVVNGGSRVTAAINVAVVLIDSEGKRVGSAEALVSSTALMPNAQADFEARFSDDTNFNEVQFTLKTVELELGQPTDGEELDEPVGDEPHATAKTSAKPRS